MTLALIESGNIPVTEIQHPSSLLIRLLRTIVARMIVNNLEGDNIYIKDLVPIEKCGRIYLTEVWGAKPSNRIRRAGKPVINIWDFDPPVAIPVLNTKDRIFSIAFKHLGKALANDLLYQALFGYANMAKHLEISRNCLNLAIDLIPSLNDLNEYEKFYLSINWGTWLSKLGEFDYRRVKHE